MKNKNLILYIAAIICIITNGCNKAEFLDAKPRTTISIPSTLQDLRQLLDNELVMNQGITLGDVSSDDYYLSASYWQNNVATTRGERNAYIWAEDIFEGQGAIPDWNLPYQQVLIANVVIDRLGSIERTSTNRAEWDDLKGAAHFYRAYAFHNLMELFAPPYDEATAHIDLGIPLKLQGDVNEAIFRSSVAECYQQILADLNTASSLLGTKVPLPHINRPSKPAALGALARIYLNMRQYSNALRYADSCLGFHNKLIDYNTLNRTAPIPFSIQNDETIFHARMLNANLATNIIHTSALDVKVDTVLYALYQTGDIRKFIFFNTNNTFKKGGSYSGIGNHFTGIATDEIYLIRAESRVREGNINGALADLNTLLSHRYESPYTAITESNPTALLHIILTERRKELVRRGIRWSDLRRLNKEGRSITLTRKLGESTYTLSPNSPKYVLPIPPDEIGLSNIPQNNRISTTGS